MIYFIGNKEMNICKIGYSKKPYRRIDTIRKQTPFELEIFNIIEGDPSVEKMYHSTYFNSRIKGEWFKLKDIQELGFNKSIVNIEIGHIKLNINKNNYVHLGSLLSSLNEDRIFIERNTINFNVWKTSNKSFLETIDTPIIKETCIWIHLFVAFELIRTSTVKNKIALYEYLYDTNQAVRLGVKENIK